MVIRGTNLSMEAYTEENGVCLNNTKVCGDTIVVGR